MADIFSLNEQLNSFREIILGGRGKLIDPINLLLKAMVTIEIAFAGIYLAIGGQANHVELCKKILKVGTLFWLVTNYAEVLDWLYFGFLYVGKAVGGLDPTSTTGNINNPDSILAIATNFLGNLWQYSRTGGATNAVGLPTLTTIIIFILAIPAYVAIALMAINAFVTYLEFSLISAAAIAFVPFGLFKPFSWLFDRAQGAIFSLGIKAMVLALVVALTSTVLNHNPLSNVLTTAVQSADVNEDIIMRAVTYENCAQFFLMSLTLLILSFHAPSLAVSLLGGGPQLTAGSIASALRGTMHNLESAKSVGTKAGSMTTAAVATPTMATLKASAALGGGARGALQGLKQINGTNSSSSEAGGKSNGIGQLAKSGMAAMYGATAATAGAAVKSAYGATGGKFEKALADKGTRGEIAGRQSIINASSLFGSKGKNDKEGAKAKNDTKDQKNDTETKKAGNSDK